MTKSLRPNNVGLFSDDQTKTRTHLDWQGEAPQAGGADFIGGCVEVVSREAARGGQGYF